MNMKSIAFLTVSFLFVVAQAAPEASKMKLAPAKKAPAVKAERSAASLATMTPVTTTSAKNTALSLENYFPAAQKGNLTIKPTFKTGTASGTFRNAADRFEASREVRANTLDIEGAFALSEKWAVSVANSVGEEKEDLKIASSKTKEFTMQGLSDFDLTAKARAEAETGLMFYGLTYSWSPEARDYNVGNTTSNRYSGGNSLSAFYSYERNSGTNNVLGLKISYLMLEDRALTVKEGNVLSKQSMDGGNTLALGGFNEFHKANYVLGVAGQIAFVDSMTWKANQGNQKILGTEAATMLSAKVYGMSKMAGDWEVIPALAFTTNLNRAGVNTFETNDEIALNVAARLGL